MSSAPAVTLFLVSLTVLCTFLAKVIQLGYRQVRNHEKTQELVTRLADNFEHLADSLTTVIGRIDTLERTLNNGIRSEIRQAIEEAAEAKKEAIDARRAVDALSAEVDVYTNVVIDDRRRIRQIVKAATGIDIADTGD